jgi:integral membrane protein
MSKLKALYWVAIAETISWIGLILGMVMKYGFEEETLVSIFGRVHGFLFLAYVALALLCHVEYRWAIKRTLIVLIAAIPPFVGLWVVHSILEQAEGERTTAVA